jgi:biopolymer transport protein ExbB/TolQ
MLIVMSFLLLIAMSAIFVLFLNNEPSEQRANLFLCLFICFWLCAGLLCACVYSLHQSAQFWEAQFWKNDNLAADLLREKEKERLEYAKFIRSKGYSLDSINISNPEN